MSKVVKKLVVIITNHPYKGWSQEQQRASEELLSFEGETDYMELPFPNVPPAASPEGVAKIGGELLAPVKDWCEKVCEREGIERWQLRDRIAAVIQGEPSLAMWLTAWFHANINSRVGVFVATTERMAVETRLPNGEVEKTSKFSFCQFRRITYPAACPDCNIWGTTGR